MVYAALQFPLTADPDTNASGTLTVTPSGRRMSAPADCITASLFAATLSAMAPPSIGRFAGLAPGPERRADAHRPGTGATRMRNIASERMRARAHPKYEQELMAPPRNTVV